MNHCAMTWSSVRAPVPSGFHRVTSSISSSECKRAGSFLFTRQPDPAVTVQRTQHLDPVFGVAFVSGREVRDEFNAS